MKFTLPKVNSKFALHAGLLVLSAVLPAGAAYLSGHPVFGFAATGIVIRLIAVLEPALKKEAQSG